MRTAKNMQTEKRKHPRYEKASMQLSVARPGFAGILKINPDSECTNFSRTGLQFESEQAFEFDERLVMDLSIHDIHLKELNAVVVQSNQNASGNFCTGIKFCFEAKRMQKSQIKTALLNIEDQLRVATEFPT